MTRSLVLPYALLGCASTLLALGQLFGLLRDPPVARDGELVLRLATDLCLMALPVLALRTTARRARARSNGDGTRRALRRIDAVLATSVGVTAMSIAWTPVPLAIWTIGGAAGRLVDSVQWGGWAFVGLQALRIGPTHVVGLRWALSVRAGRPLDNSATPPSPGGAARHPIAMGILAILWAAPTMTADRLLLAATVTVAVLIAFVASEIALIRDATARWEPARIGRTPTARAS